MNNIINLSLAIFLVVVTSSSGSAQGEDDQTNVIKNLVERVRKLEALTKKQSLEIKDCYVKVSEVKTKVGNLNSFITKESLVLADLQKKDNAISGFHMGYNQPTDLKNGRTMLFGTEFENMGSDYNTDTGTYTAPVDGLYVFHLLITPFSDSDNIQCGMKTMADNQVKSWIWIMDKSQSSASTLFRLNKGHQVLAWVNYTNNNRVLDSPFTTFTGYLLKAL